MAAELHEPMAMEPARMGGAIWLNKRPFRHRKFRCLLLQRQRRLRLYWSRKPARHWNASQLEPVTSAQLNPLLFSAPSALQQFRSRSPAAIRRSSHTSSKRSKTALLQMPHRYCGSCSSLCTTMTATVSAFPVSTVWLNCVPIALLTRRSTKWSIDREHTRLVL